VTGVSLSAVVPTRDRPAALARCLAALRAQSIGDLDLVVVDDGSRDRGPVSDVAAAAGARLVRSPGRGPAAARNLGARACRGEVILFTDDDCEPRPDWAALLAGALDDNVMVAAGRTDPPPDAGAAVSASQAITNRLLLASLRPDRSLGFAPTCNLAATAGLLARIPFDEGFPDAAGEDRDWWARVGESGVASRYVSGAVVTHRPALRGRGLLRQQFRYGRGAVRYRRAGAGRGLGRPSLYAGMVRDGFRAGPAAGGLVVAAQLVTAAGALSERLGSGRTQQ
jgi:glycosyltransferase involved in cell wall biosynthesis